MTIQVALSSPQVAGGGCFSGGLGHADSQLTRGVRARRSEAEAGASVAASRSLIGPPCRGQGPDEIAHVHGLKRRRFVSPLARRTVPDKHEPFPIRLPRSRPTFTRRNENPRAAGTSHAVGGYQPEPSGR